MSTSKNTYSRIISANSVRCSAVASFVASQITNESLWPCIVFVRRKLHAYALAEAISLELKKIPSEVSPVVQAITAGTPAATRDALATRMRACDPRCPAVVATDVWAVGVDIPSIRAVFIAGQGSAPIGGVQRPGRGVRKSSGKPGYVVFDIQDLGVPRYEKQNAQRLANYEAAGFVVEGMRAVPGKKLGGTMHDIDVLYEQPVIVAAQRQKQHEQRRQVQCSRFKQWVLSEIFGLWSHHLILVAAIVLLILMCLFSTCVEALLKLQ